MRSLDRRTRSAILMGAALAMGAAMADKDVRSVVSRPFAVSGTVVLPDRYLRGWDPITVFFPEARGPATPGPEDHPERYVRLEPDWPGAWRWVDAKTLQLQPADPWPALGAFQVRAGGGTVALTTLSDPPFSVTPTGAGLEPVDTITLSFQDAVEPGVLARMIRLETRPLPGLDPEAARWRGSGDFEVKRLYTGVGAAQGEGSHQTFVYAVLLDEPIPPDTRATLHLRLSRDEGAEARYEASFSTAADFRVSGVGCPSSVLPVPPEGASFADSAPATCEDRAVVVDFSATPAALRDTDARDLIQISPPVEGLSFQLQGSRMVVRGAFAPDRAYRVQIQPAAILDTRGRPLRGEQSTRLTVRFLPAQRYVRLVDGQGLLERYGPLTVPLELSGEDALDLRIYKVDPRDAAYWPMSDGPVLVDEGQRPPDLSQDLRLPGADAGRYVNSGQRATYIRALGSPPVSTLIQLTPPQGRTRVGLDLQPWLDRISGADRPGTYLVGVRSVSGDTRRQYMRVQVTDLSLTAVEEAGAVRFYVTSLSTGLPVVGATVRLEGRMSTDDEEVWGELARVTTGADGSATWTAPGEQDSSRRPKRVVVERGDDVLVLDADSPPPTWQQNHWSTSGSGWLSWAFRPLKGREEAPRTLCHVWTERPVYRPEEEVHLQAWARTLTEGELKPTQGSLKLTVNGPPGNSWTFPLDLDENGGLYQRLEAPDRPSGSYSVTVAAEGGGTLCSTSFQTESYRIPTFEVTLHGPKAATTDAAFPVQLTASYYAGGRLADRPVRWRVTRFPATWQPPERPGYVFASDARYSGTSRSETEARLEQEARTDGQGGASLTLDPTREPDARPRTYVVEATVTAEDASTVTSTTRVDAIPAFVLGVKAPRWLDGGTQIPLEVVAVDGKGALVPGIEVEAKLSRREWHSVLADADITSSAPRYRTDTVDVPLGTQSFQTAATASARSFPVDRAGVYVVELSARDSLRRAQRLSVDLYVAGPDDQAWGKPQAGVFTLTPSQASYKPGDVAKIVLQSPFSTGRALAVTESPQGNKYQWIDVRGGAATLRVPIDEGWAPKIPVHVVLMRGRTEGSEPNPNTSGGGGLDLGKPSTVAAMTWLEIEPVERKLAVTLSNPARALPGETVPITVKLSTPDGRPTSGEVALWLVDGAVLALGREARLDPLPSFLHAMSSRLLFRDTRNLAYGRIPFPSAPGGDGGEEGGLLERMALRKDMKPVPYYEPHLKVGSSGSATVKVKLPDNLTVFKIRAKAIAGPDRFGAGSSEIAVRQPVVVQPSLPRFARPGDRFVASAVGRVVEGAAGEGSAEIRAEGLEVRGAKTAKLALDLERPALARFEIVVPTPTYDAEGRLVGAQATVRLGVQRAADGAGDAVETTLPIRDDRVAQLSRQTLALVSGAPTVVPAAPAARPGSLRRALVASDVPGVSQAAGAAASLVRWPYGDTPALLARARGWLALDALRDVLSPGATASRAAEAVHEATELLAQRVDGRGLVAAFPGADGRVWLTADAYQLLVEARAAGMQVPPTLLLRLSESLQRSLRSDVGVCLSGEEQVERSLALLALARGGRLDGGYFAELMRTAQISNLDGVAAILRAGLAGAPADRTRALSLLPMLQSAIVTRLEAGREVYDHLQGQRPRDSRILGSEARTLATLVRALQEAAPEDPKLAVAREALLRVGGADGWGSPTADAEAIMALVERLEAPPVRPWTLTYSEGGRESRLIAEERSIVSALSAGAGELKLHSTDAPALQVWVETRWLPAEDGANAKAEAAGFVVERTLERVGSKGEPGEREALDAPGRALPLKVGDIVEDHVSIVSPKERGYVAVVVPLAAGLELMNPRLSTSPPEARPRATPSVRPTWEDWRDDEVVYYFETLPAGTLTLAFRARATFAGSFVQPPARVELLEDRAVRGSSNGARVEISGS